jgi:hypothetical protein
VTASRVDTTQLSSLEIEAVRQEVSDGRPLYAIAGASGTFGGSTHSSP